MYTYMFMSEGVFSIMFITKENGIGDKSSNPWKVGLHFILH